MATSVQPERILKDLAKLWIDLGKDDQQKGSAGVLRACAMTLIAAVEEEGDAQAVSETIAQIMHQHPSRMIVMRVDGGEPDSLDARVFAQCWMPFGRQQQICCEEIEITASQSRVEDLPKLVLGIMVPDLPVVLWCRGERLFRDPAFQNLFRLADKIIVDSARFQNSAEALPLIRQAVAAGYNVSDLSWTRLTRLRQTIAQIFENQSLLPALKHLERVIISYSGPSATDPSQAPASLQYLVSWFHTTVSAEVETVFRQTQPAYEILGISMEGPDLHASVELQENAAAIYVNGLSRRISFPKQTDCDLMREELSILGPDPTFRRVLG
jgi:glucose-6-phosphate dehydrogenase assembly protein OpcA